MADTYGFDLKHIFEYITPYDVTHLLKQAQPRMLRRENAQWRTLGNVVRVAGYYEKGSDKQFDSFMANFVDRDESYLNRPFDKAGLNALAQQVAQNRAMAN